jgi:hypothetical protein
VRVNEPRHRKLLTAVDASTSDERVGIALRDAVNAIDRSMSPRDRHTCGAPGVR